MPIHALNHYAIRSADMKHSRDFYVEVLGLVEGERPPFPFPGYWLYCGDQAAVHIVGQDVAARGYGPRTGALDHIAFSASGVEAMRERLQRLDVPYSERTVPLMGLRQLFVTDPDGITLELNFPATVDE